MKKLNTTNYISFLNFISFSLLLLPAFVVQAQTITVQVNNLTTPNSSTKSGYNLIWSDEFPGTSLSTSYWNKSTTDDDGTTNANET